MLQCREGRGHFRQFEFHIAQSPFFFQRVLYGTAIIFAEQSPERENSVFPCFAFLRVIGGRGQCMPQDRSFTQQQPIERDATRLRYFYA